MELDGRSSEVVGLAPRGDSSSRWIPGIPSCTGACWRACWRWSWSRLRYRGGGRRASVPGTRCGLT